MTPQDLTERFAQIADAHGFELSPTGGGCTALTRDFGAAIVYITDGEGAEPPIDGFAVGVYDADNDFIWEQRGETLSDYRKAITSAITIAQAEAAKLTGVCRNGVAWADCTCC